MKLFRRFLLIWLIGTVASVVPLGYFGLIFGAISVLINAVMLTLIFHKELQ